MPNLSLRHGLPALLALVVFFLARSAQAGVELEMSSVLGDIRPEGEVLVRVRNSDGHDLRGVVSIESRHPSEHTHARRPFAVGPKSTSFVKVPVALQPYGEDIIAVARDEAGNELARVEAGSRVGGSFILLEIAPPGARLQPFHVDAKSSPALRRVGGGVTVSTAPTNEPTGQYILPERASTYSHVAMVMVAASELETLDATSRDVLLAWVEGGGNLAVAVRETADLARPTLVRLVGAGVHAAPFERKVGDPSEKAQYPEQLEDDAEPAALSPAIAAKLTGFAGGRVRRSQFGAVAEVGLGNVHLLAIDPWSKEANGDRWVQAQIVELASERGRSAIGHTSVGDGFYPDSILRALDANESFRVALGVATVLLLVYAVGVGPIVFRRLARRGPVLAPYRWTLVASATTFAVIVLVGLVAKGGFGRRARQLALVEVASGDPIAVERGYRAFYTSSGRVIDIAGSSPRSSFAEPSAPGAVIATSAAGASTLAHVAVRPWETVAVREDATITLGQGITIAGDGDDLAVTNRSGFGIRDAILASHDNAVCFGLGTIADGATARSRGARHLDSSTCADATQTPGWRAFHAAFFAQHVDRPVLFGELDTPVPAEDTGFRIDRHTVLVRVVGGGS